MPTDKTRKYVLIATVAVLLSSLLVYRPPAAGLWWQALFEWLHVPVFGLIAITLLALTPVSWTWWQRFGAAFAGSIALAFLTEAAQIPMARSASMKDIVSDLAGAVSFLLAAAAFRLRFAAALPALLISLAIVYWSALPLISASWAIRDRDARFPVLFTGDVNGSSDFVSGRNVRMETRWDRDSGRLYTRTVFLPGQAPSMKFLELSPDWRGHTVLKLFVEVESDAPIIVTIRVHDRAHRRGNQPYSDRFNRRVTLDHGFNVVNLPLSEIENAPQGRTMDMSRIETLVVFSSAVEAERVLNFYELRLE
jgi:hypothetical protein